MTARAFTPKRPSVYLHGNVSVLWNGSAEFPSLSINDTGRDYSIEFTIEGRPWSVTSNLFDVKSGPVPPYIHLPKQLEQLGGQVVIANTIISSSLVVLSLIVLTVTAVSSGSVIAVGAKSSPTDTSTWQLLLNYILYLQMFIVGVQHNDKFEDAWPLFSSMRFFQGNIASEDSVSSWAAWSHCLAIKGISVLCLTIIALFLSGRRVRTCWSSFTIHGNVFLPLYLIAFSPLLESLLEAPGGDLWYVSVGIAVVIIRVLLHIVFTSVATSFNSEENKQWRWIIPDGHNNSPIGPRVRDNNEGIPEEEIIQEERRNVQAWSAYFWRPFFEQVMWYSRYNIDRNSCIGPLRASVSHYFQFIKLIFLTMWVCGAVLLDGVHQNYVLIAIISFYMLLMITLSPYKRPFVQLEVLFSCSLIWQQICISLILNNPNRIWALTSTVVTLVVVVILGVVSVLCFKPLGAKDGEDKRGEDKYVEGEREQNPIALFGASRKKEQSSSKDDLHNSTAIEMVREPQHDGEDDRFDHVAVNLSEDRSSIHSSSDGHGEDSPNGGEEYPPEEYPGLYPELS